jgi:hypothetical protein
MLWLVGVVFGGETDRHCQPAEENQNRPQW